NNEPQLIPYIQSCNIACGGHAGDDKSMNFVAEIAIKHQVKIGAHPSYPDRENFGRKSMNLEFSDLKTSIQNQINSLKKIVEDKGSKLYHIKPHGALYNDLVKNKELSMQFLNIILPYKKELKLFVPFNSEIEKCALQEGFNIIYEAFADRNYNDDLSLVSRDKKDAVISNIDVIIKHVFEILNNGFVTSITGKKIVIKATTFCVHSDTKNAVEIVRNLHQKFMN
ncbi:MAG: 5-oxoprolinase subunit PxpA, partial [Flavobacteriaceae bacterium]|nr:5-oxoprolinase subunit PxpA [Flavobacteriaceae bacterium]